MGDDGTNPIHKLKSLELWRKKDFWPVNFETDQLQVATFCLDREGEVYRHKHGREDQVWYIMSGSGFVTLGDQEFGVVEGDAMLIPKNTFHSARTATERMRILQVECVVHSKPKRDRPLPDLQQKASRERDEQEKS